MVSSASVVSVSGGCSASVANASGVAVSTASLCASCRSRRWQPDHTQRNHSLSPYDTVTSSCSRTATATTISRWPVWTSWNRAGLQGWFTSRSFPPS
ncbi:hypothetical protein PF008_g2316 [Phytophthora fragariae]|uniref:Uncharacterized protein n=1 Tax=Phytophthora fragariae TaxID=53985 RepID=A0A6G0SHG6_9STRA|nr:hypothetical protein PF008_g2316 [Phytophthora fragariae]